MPTDEMAVQIKAHDRASGVINHVGKRLGFLNKQGISVGIAFAAVNMGVQALHSAFSALKQWLTESIKKFREFERSMSEVATMLVGMDQTYLPNMTDAVNEMSITFAKGAIDLTRGLYQILSAGIEASRSIEVLRSSAKLALVAISDVETAVDAVTTVLNAYGMAAIQAEYVSEILWKSVQLGKQRLDDIAGALGYVVPLAAKINLAFEEISAALATLTKQGLSAHKAARGLRMVMANLVSPAEEAVGAMVELGIAYDELTIQAMGLQGTLGMINTAAEGNISSITRMIGNVQALTSALGLMGKQGDMFQTSLEYIENDINALNEAYSDIANTTDFMRRRQEMLSDTVDRSVGEAIEPADRAWADFINALKIGVTEAGALDYIFGGAGIIRKGYERIGELADEAQRLTDEALDVEKIDDYAAAFNRAETHISDTTTLLRRMQLQQKMFNDEIKSLEQQRDILVATHEYREALEYIPLALKDAAFTTKIFDNTTQALVDSIRIQREEIEKLNDANRQYSIETRSNQIEIMKIQLDASKKRGRMSRSQKKTIEDLNRANLENRIFTMENEQAIDAIKDGGLTAEEQRLDKIIIMYQERVKEIEDSYERELQSLDNQIGYKKILQADYVKYIAKIQKDLTDSWTAYYANLRRISQNMPQISGMVNPPAPYTSTTAVGKSAPEIFQYVKSRILGRKPIGSRGIPTTGLYHLEQGEKVISRNKNIGRGRPVPITIAVKVYNYASLERLGEQVGRLISSGIISNIDSEMEIG